MIPKLKLKGIELTLPEIEKVIKKLEYIDYTYCYLNRKIKMILINCYKKNINKNIIYSHIQKFLPIYMILKKY